MAKILSIIVLFSLCSLSNEVKAQNADRIYFYVWVEHSKTGKYFITEVQHIEIDDCGFNLTWSITSAKPTIFNFFSCH